MYLEICWVNNKLGVCLKITPRDTRPDLTKVGRAIGFGSPRDAKASYMGAYSTYEFNDVRPLLTGICMSTLLVNTRACRDCCVTHVRSGKSWHQCLGPLEHSSLNSLDLSSESILHVA
jgi:hypothetical protein